MKIHFISFADKKYRKTLERIKEEAERTKFFDTVKIYSENDLAEDFMERSGEFIRSNQRGFGYWIWKPQVAIQRMNEIEEGDILVYADAGCSIYSSGVSVFSKYIQETIKNKVCVFQLEYIEKKYCKMDLLKEIGGDPDSLTICATFYYMMKTKENLEFLNEWLRLCQTPHLVDDSPSVIPNDPSFLDHRHDQSIFSLLLKKYRKEPVIPDYSFIKDSRIRY